MVIYFYPKAFARAARWRLHAFAEAMPQFTALGANVIGVQPRRPSRHAGPNFGSRCASKFPANLGRHWHIMKAYDAVLAKAPELANRTSRHLVAPDHRVLAEYTDLDYSKHVDTMLAALTSWKAGQH